MQAPLLFDYVHSSQAASAPPRYRGTVLVDELGRVWTPNASNTGHTVGGGAPVTTSGASGVGRKLKANLTPGYTVTGWRWHRVAANGTDSVISGATADEYTQVTGDDDVNVEIYPEPMGLTLRALGVVGKGSVAAPAPSPAPSPSPSPAPAPSPSVPTNSAAPTITGTAQSGQTLTGVHGTWTGSPTSYAYQWKRGATVVGTAQTYPVVDADVGSTLTFSETASNATGPAASAATSAATATVIAAVVVASTAPKFGYGAAILESDTAGKASLFASMSAIPGGTNGGKTSTTFATTGSSTLFTYIAVLGSAAASGIRVYDGTSYGGFSGAGSANNYNGSEVDPSTTHLTYTDGSGNLWFIYRSDGKAVSYSNWSLTN